MKKLYLFLVFLICLCARSYASHVVGGEIIIRHTNNPAQPNEYEFTLQVGRDITGISLSTQAELRLLDKRTLTTRRVLTLPQFGPDTAVSITANCTGTVQTFNFELRRFRVTTILDAATFFDTLGYIAVWQECCKNPGMINIQGAGSQGTSITAEFPSVVYRGLPFVNSTPRNFNILRSFICRLDTFSFYFSGGLVNNFPDPDGDSLTYHLVNPLDYTPGAPAVGGSINTAPRPNNVTFPFTNSPFDPNDWQAPYNTQVQINGTTPPAVGGAGNLTIDSRGILRVRPVTLGRYTFAIQISQYRNVGTPGAPQWKYIGNQRREFQVLVSSCQNNILPTTQPITGVGATGPDGSIEITGRGTRCGTFNVVKPLSQEQITTSPTANNAGRVVTITGSWINPPDSRLANEAVILDPATRSNSITIRNTATTLAGSQVPIPVSICLGDCIFAPASNPAQVQLVFVDDACPRPGRDTVIVNVIRNPLTLPAPRMYNLYRSNSVEMAAVDTIDVVAGRRYFFSFESRRDNPSLVREQHRLVFDWSDIPSRPRTTAVRDTAEFGPVPGIGAGLFGEVRTFGGRQGHVFTCADVQQGLVRLRVIGQLQECTNRSLDEVRTVVFRVRERNFPAALATVENGVFSYPDEVNLQPAPGTNIRLGFQSSDVDTTRLRLVAEPMNFGPAGLSADSVFALFGMRFQTDSLGLPVSNPDSIFVNSVFNYDYNCAANLEGLPNPLQVKVRLIDTVCTAQIDSVIINIFKFTGDLYPTNVVLPGGSQANQSLRLTAPMIYGTCNNTFEQVTVYNRWGAEVYSSSDPNFQFRGDDLPSGTYYYTIKFSKRRYDGWVDVLR